MPCQVARLLTETDCGVCGRTVPAGYAVITNEPEFPVWLVVCMDCTSGLGGLWVAEAMFDFKGLEWPACDEEQDLQRIT